LNKRSGGGYTLIIRHESPRVWTVYYHLRQPSHLLKGTRVKRGEVLGQTGTTGSSTGVHLHFETRKSRRWSTDYNPETILGPEYAAETPSQGPSQPDRGPRTRMRVDMPQYGISGILKAQDVRSVNRFMAGRR